MAELRGLLDTSVVIDFDIAESTLHPEESSIASVTLAELAAGPHATNDQDERARRQDRLQWAASTWGELNEIVRRTTAEVDSVVEPMLDDATIIAAQKLARRIVVAPHVQDYAIRLCLSTHPGGPHADPKTDRYISVGVSPRGAQALICGGKVKALVDGRYAVAFSDIESVAPPALRHRVMRSFEAEADGVTTDHIIDRLLEYVPHEP